MYDQECSYKEATAEDVQEDKAGYVGERIPCCPSCNSTDTDLVFGDHGNQCLNCGDTFICP